jgi:hypothetical protein
MRTRRWMKWRMKRAPPPPPDDRRTTDLPFQNLLMGSKKIASGDTASTEKRKLEKEISLTSNIDGEGTAAQTITFHPRHLTRRRRRST